MKRDSGAETPSHVIKGLQAIPLSSNVTFSRQPDIFDGVLFRRVCGERDQMNGPFRLRPLTIQGAQIRFDLITPVIPRPIPQTNDRTALMTPAQPLQKGDGVGPIRCVCRKERCAPIQ